MSATRDIEVTIRAVENGFICRHHARQQIIVFNTFEQLSDWLRAVLGELTFHQLCGRCGDEIVAELEQEAAASGALMGKAK